MNVICLPASYPYKITLKDDEYIEYRLDLQEHQGKTNHLLINNKTIITWRTDTAEPYQKKIDLFTQLVQGFNCLVDIELENYRFYQHLFNNMILSTHLDKFDINALKRVKECFEARESKYYKLAIKIDKYADLISLRALFQDFQKPIFIMSTGKLSIISRILYNYLNSHGAYMGINGYLTTENQIDREYFYQFNASLINIDSLIGGLVGGQQIYSSIGYAHYNHLPFFQTNNAFYLPFYTDDLADLIYFIMNSKLRFYGLSITMPYKYLQSQNTPINTYLIKTNKYTNTDILAFTDSFYQLKTSTDDRVLLIGSGASTESALIALKQSNHQMDKVFISARNHERIAYLTDKYSISKLDNNLHFDLLINCSPVDIYSRKLDIKQISYHSLINLPYTISQTALPMSNSIDGKAFWRLQAKYQEQLFNQEILSF